MKRIGFLREILRLLCFLHALFVSNSALAESTSSTTCDKDNECQSDMASAVKTMRAVVAEAGKLVLVNRPVPVAKEGEVLVKIHYTAINRADTLQRAGKYPVPPGETDILGLEMSGTVVGNGTTKFPTNSKVMSLLGGGGYAEYVAVDENMLMPVPDGVSLRVAAGIPETWLTAYQLLHFVTEVKANDTVVIHAGGSGVGTAATQLATQHGCRVFVTAGTDEKIAKGVELGATGGANYKKTDWDVEILNQAGDDGVNAVLDCVGGSYWKQNANVLSVDGRWTLYGLMGGAQVEGPLLGLMLRKRLRMQATTLRSRSLEYKKELTKEFSSHALDLFASQRYQVIVDKESFDLETAQESHDYMETNANIGKILLKVAAEDTS